MRGTGRGRRLFSALFGAALLGTAVPGREALAAEERGFSEERVMALRDNVLEYSEIQDMIRLYNPTVEEAAASYNRTLKQYADARATMKFGQASVKTDKEEAKDDGNMEDYAQYASDEAIYRSAAKTYQTMYENMQERSSTSSLRQTERQMTVAAQALMQSYASMENERKAAEKMRELYQKQYELAKAKAQAGMATEAELLSAQERVLAAEAAAASAEAGQLSIYDSLCLMVGRETDGSLKIGEIPEADPGRVDSYDLAADTKKAIGNNYDLISDRHSLSVDSTSSSHYKLRTMEEGEEKLAVRMNCLYRQALQKRDELKTARTAYERASQEKQNAEAKYRAGLISQEEYLAAQLEMIQNESQYQSANLALVQAMEDYEWAVLGIAEIE